MKLIFFFIHYNITIFFLHCTDISFWLITEQNNHIWFGLICHIGCHIYLLDAIFIYLTFLHSPPLVKRSNLWFLNWYNQALTGNAKTISTLPVPIPDEEKKKLNFYFHTFLWCLKRLYEGPKGFKRSRREFFIKMSWKTWTTARMLFTSRSLLLEEFYVRSSQLELFWQKGVLRNFVKFTGRRRWQSQKK